MTRTSRSSPLIPANAAESNPSSAEGEPQSQSVLTAPVARPSESLPSPMPGFDDCYAANFNSLTLQLYAYTGDLAQAQDLVQEAFCRALERWNRIHGYDDPVAWVRRVAWNLATNRWRQLRRHWAFMQRHREQHVPAPSPDHVALTSALAALPTRHRQAVVMHYIADMSISEIARQLDAAEGTVKSWLHRGRIALATALTDQRGESHDA